MSSTTGSEAPLPRSSGRTRGPRAATAARTGLGLMGAVALLIACLPAAAAAAGEAECNRACIVARVQEYVAALVAHDPQRVRLGEDVRSTENGKDTPIGAGVWRTITAQEEYRQVIVDSRLDSAVFFGAFREREDPMLLAIRLRFAGREITELEHLVSRPDWRNRLILRHRLTAPNPVYQEVLPEARRSSRVALIAAAHAYFDGIARSSDAGVPMHPECSRRENRVVLLENPKPGTEPCPTGFHRFNYITDVRDRRLGAVDEARGLVVMWAFFDVPGNVAVAPRPFGPSDASAGGEPRVDTRKIPRSLYIAELFRVVDGRIRDIEAIMYNLDLGTTAPW